MNNLQFLAAYDQLHIENLQLKAKVLSLGKIIEHLESIIAKHKIIADPIDKPIDNKA